MNKIVLAIGVIALIVGLGAYAYTITTEDEALGGLIKEEETTAPYRNISVPIIIGSLVLIIAGFFIPESS